MVTKPVPIRKAACQFVTRMHPKGFAKFIRPEKPTPGIITERDLDIIEAILRYRFSPTSQPVRLVGGNEDITFRRLRRLWERGMAFPLSLPV